jgi:cytosine/adenosine deaminase-related metal-dependent hydrolase
VCHHNPLHAPLRRPFPVRVIRNYRYSHSLEIDGDDVATVCHDTPAEWPWIVHAAEGVDVEASREIDRLDAMGCLGARTVLVHGVGIAPAQIARLLACGTSLVWCPSSNDFLFGRTAAVERFAQAGCLALGTDSRLSGAADLFAELRAAYATGQLSATALVRTVTVDAARVLRTRTGGRLEPGVPADLTILHPHAERPENSLIASTRADVRLAMIDGRPLVGEQTMSAVFDASSTETMTARVDDRARLVARWIGRRVLAMRMREPGLEVAA